MKPDVREISDFPGYFIDVYGNVWSRLRPGRRPIGSEAIPRDDGPFRRCAISFTRGGYRSVGLRRNGENHRRYVHRLVLQTFVGPCPDGMEACHYDGDRNNNQLDNLRWDTHRENKADNLRHGTRLMGEKVGNSKLVPDDVRRIFDLRAAGHLQREIALMVGVSRPLVSMILGRKIWKHLIIYQE